MDIYEKLNQRNAPGIHDFRWADYQVPVFATNLGGTKDPSFEKFIDDGNSSQGVFLYHFSPSQEQELYFTMRAPAGWKEYTPIYPYIQFCKKTADAGDVVWGGEATFTKVGESFPNSQFVQADSTLLYDGGAMHNSVAIFPPLDVSATTIMAGVVARMFRDATNEADTYPEKVALIGFGVYYQVDSIGSLYRFNKHTHIAHT